MNSSKKNGNDNENLFFFRSNKKQIQGNLIQIDSEINSAFDQDYALLNLLFTSPPIDRYADNSTHFSIQFLKQQKPEYPNARRTINILFLSISGLFWNEEHRISHIAAFVKHRPPRCHTKSLAVCGTAIRSIWGVSFDPRIEQYILYVYAHCIDY